MDLMQIAFLWLIDFTLPEDATKYSLISSKNMVQDTIVLFQDDPTIFHWEIFVYTFYTAFAEFLPSWPKK